MKFKLNPFSWLLLWIDLAITMPYIHGYFLYIISFFIILFSFYKNSKSLLTLLSKSKYFVISIIVIYVIMTPLNWQYSLWIAFDEILKLITLISTLNLVFFYNNRQLITSIYYLCYLFKKLGFNFERFIVRLSLTLSYIEIYLIKYDKSHITLKQQLKNFLILLSNHSQDSFILKVLNQQKHLDATKNSEDNNNMKNTSDKPEQTVNLYRASLEARRKKFIAEHYDSHDIELAEFLYSSLDKIVVLASLAGVAWLFVHSLIHYI